MCSVENKTKEEVATWLSDNDLDDVVSAFEAAEVHPLLLTILSLFTHDTHRQREREVLTLAALGSDRRAGAAGSRGHVGPGQDRSSSLLLSTPPSHQRAPTEARVPSSTSESRHPLSPTLTRGLNKPQRDASAPASKSECAGARVTGTHSGRPSLESGGPA